jgi:hypothetical protein
MLAGYLFVCIALIVVLTTRYKVHPFVVLLMVALLYGFLAGMPLEVLIASVNDGFGSTLSGIGLIIILGVIIGTFLENTGGAYAIAQKILAAVGKKNAVPAMGIMGYVVSIPVFADSGFILVSPLNKSLSKKAGLSLAGTAVAGIDFVPVSGTLEFQPGDISREITVSLLPQISTQERAFVLRASWQQSDGSPVSATGAIVILGTLQTEIPDDNNPPDDGETPPDPEEPPWNLRFSALVGGDVSLVHFTDGASGFQFFRARNSDCDIDAVMQCTAGQEDLLEDTAILDNALTLNDEAYYWLRYNGYQSDPLHVASGNDRDWPDAPPARFEHRLVAFNERLWLIGGTTTDRFENYRSFHDVWASSDGIYWQLIGSVTSTQDPDYAVHKAVNYNGALWALDEESGILYRSTNGGEWEIRDDSLPILEASARISQQLVVLGEQLLLIGDIWNDGYMVEVLSYDEDSGWTDWRDNPPFSSMFGVRAAGFNGELWLIGPVYQDGQETSGLWRSPNGIDWTEERNTNRMFGDYYYHQVAVFRDRLWVVGGASSETDFMNTSEIWSSENGSLWQLETELPGFAPRSDFQLAVFNNKLWLHGGMDYYLEEPTLGDTWVTEDGVNWKRVYRGIIHFPGENGGPALVFE